MNKAYLALPLMLAACAPAQQMTSPAAQVAPAVTKEIEVRNGTTVAEYHLPVDRVMQIAAESQKEPGWNALPYLTPQTVHSFAAPQQVIRPGKTYRAVLNTSKGLITLDLYADKAPQAVNNFVFLARHHFYAGTRFHRVIDGFMAQGGDPLTLDDSRRAEWGTGDPGYSFRYEVGNGLNFDQAGTLGMARSASPDSQGSQFFITLAPASFLNDQYTVFGRVVDGMDALRALTKTAQSGPSGEQPIQDAIPDRINTVTILER